MVETEHARGVDAPSRFDINAMSITDVISDALFMIDPETDRILDANPRAAEMLGYSLDELRRLNVSQIHPGEMDRLHEFACAVKAKGHGITETLSCRTSLGHSIPAEVAATFYTDIEGRRCMVCIVRDISERKRALDVLRESERQLGNLNTMKNVFITMVSHEMNTPLACIAGALTTLKEERLGSLAESQRRYLSLACRNLDRLMRLSSDLVDISQMMAETFGVALRDTDISDAIASGCSSLRGLATDRGIALLVSMPPSLDLPHLIDKRRLTQAVANLVRNGLENARTQVEVKVRTTDHSLILTVEDDGKGFLPAELPRIFDEFYIGTEKRKTGGGVGLGLAIARKIVELHGGSIVAENRSSGDPSTVASGARVIVTLPLSERDRNTSPR